MGRVRPRTSASAAVTAHRCRMTAHRKPHSTSMARDSVYASWSETAAGNAAHTATVASATREPTRSVSSPAMSSAAPSPQTSASIEATTGKPSPVRPISPRETSGKSG